MQKHCLKVKYKIFYSIDLYENCATNERTKEKKDLKNNFLAQLKSINMEKVAKKIGECL